jgi:hypothetical protein
MTRSEEINIKTLVVGERSAVAGLNDAMMSATPSRMAPTIRTTPLQRIDDSAMGQTSVYK